MAESGKSKKIGRNAAWCKAYRLSETRSKNKVLRLLRHFKRYGFTSAPAVHCYNNLPERFKPAHLKQATLAASKAVLKRREQEGAA